MTNEELRRWIRDRTDMYLGTVQMDADIVLGLIGQIDTLRELKDITDKLLENYRIRLGEGLPQDQSGPTNEVSPKECQYYFKDAHRYCVRIGPHNEHSTEVDLAKDKWSAHSTSAICLICNFTLSAHADEYCPVTVGGIVTRFISDICHLTWSAASGLKIKEISHDELVMCKIKGPHDINTCLHLSYPRP